MFVFVASAYSKDLRRRHMCLNNNQIVRKLIWLLA